VAEARATGGRRRFRCSGRVTRLSRRGASGDAQHRGPIRGRRVMRWHGMRQIWRCSCVHETQRRGCAVC
jgi:hypothetical protein